ncbi:MAG: hypothetical protein K0R34_1587 [Herbinix sp.]|jgi:spore germination protein|nr:hypothetical protein [Herbinix sp.]
MEIYVVQMGDTIDSIAQRFNVTTAKLINENNLTVPDNLVVGQTIIITYPTQLYIVKEGDSLDSIAEAFNVTVMHLFRNNPHLTIRQNIYPARRL